MAGDMFGQDTLGRAAPEHTSGASSPDQFDGDEDEGSSAAQWQSQSQDQSQPTRNTAPLQKRRRVTRACDECRRKKIKCDGKQPCTHCTVYSYDCTYDQPSNRRRNPAPQYIEALETRLHRAENLLRSVLPNVDLNDPNIDALIQQRTQSAKGSQVLGITENVSDESEHESQLRSMIESTGQLELDESGNWDFHGGSSGTVFVRRMREQFGGLLGNNQGPLFPKLARPSGIPTFDSPRSMTESPITEGGLANTIDLPSRETAKALCDDALNCACSLLRFVHQPSFYEMFNRMYDVSPETFDDAENRFLPLLYTVLALGSMFHAEPGKDPNAADQKSTYMSGIDEGLKYFRAARNMLDVTDCRDITSLQAVIFMTLFLQSSSNLSTCYSYIGVALRSGLRMGIHRNLAGNFNPIERETRRRVFWVIRKMDTYVSALLGFPQMLSSDDIDQPLPIEVDDEYITKDGVLPMPQGKTSLLYAASNAHTRLMSTLAKVIKYIYPSKGLEQSLQGSAQSSYVISHAKIREIERDLAGWLDRLPMALRPGGDGSPEVLRVQQLLRLSYAHVQMMLYRPFLHYVSEKGCAGRTIDERSYACAAACVSVSRNVVHITAEMKKRGLLVGAYWFTMYTTFFAILSLVYFVLENPDKAGSAEILADANNGKDALNGLAKKSQAADRCSTALIGLFEQLPARLKEGRSLVPTVQKKKRSAPLTAQSPTDLRNVHPSQDPREPVMGISRATTFPMQANAAQNIDSPRTSLDSVRFQSNPNLRHSYRDLMSQPTDMSPISTPITSPSSSLHPSYSLPPQFGINTGVPDLGAMMFPSNDPFAYPNQPMMAFENVKQENLMMNNSQVPPIYLPNGLPGQEYDDLQGQLFGPLPPYLAQAQTPYDFQGAMASGNMMGGGQNLNYHAGVPINDEMNFDGIFSGDGEDWSNMITDQRYR
ncbi:related to transcriptional activator Mut3p [Rhynchosporium secalis]|uniref:Related to transcriptional activator Mut3p n=1 Tax=Rhynchosporium secalis TaxID=38038 RepID=A0A1E1ML31_RHYSE|nr:related to transcriptional activator Mut3p [Rhynchosporium secalis]